MLNKKGAIGLSMNVLVVIIISIVILAGGITFLYKFIDLSSGEQEKLDQRTAQELERLLTEEGKQVVLSLNSVSLYPNEEKIFGVGVLNVGDYGPDFFVSISFDDRSVEIPNDPEKWFLYSNAPFRLEEGGSYKSPVMLTVPKGVKEGKYIVNIEIIENGQRYGNLQKFTLIVK